MSLTAVGYVKRGRASVALLLTASGDGRHARGSLQVRDPARRVTLSSVRVTRLRLTCHGLRIDGTARSGRRVLPFSAGIELPPHVGAALDVTVPGLRYRLQGTLHRRPTKAAILTVRYLAGAHIVTRRLGA